MHPDAYLADETTGSWKLDCQCSKPCVQFKCVACGQAWLDEPSHPSCSCGSLYVEWLFYALWRKAHKHDCGDPRCPMV